MAIYFNSEKGTKVYRPEIHYTKKDGRPFTCFSISDVIKDSRSEKRSYAYISCTVWDEAIPLADGDMVSINPSTIYFDTYNGKTSTKISCTIEVVKRAGDFTPPTEEYIAPKTEKFTPKEEVFMVKEEKVTNTASFNAITAKDYAKELEDADLELPFDL